MTVHHVCITTSVYGDSLRFYREQLGMELVKETAGFHGRAFNTWLKAPDGFMIELQTPKNGDAPAAADKNREGLCHLCFAVADIEQLCRSLEKGGASFELHGGKKLYEVEGGRLFKLIAPEGTVIEFRENMEI